MGLLTRRSRWTDVALTLVVIVPLTAATLAGPLEVSAHAATTHPACQASQIQVTAGATLLNTGYNESTPTGIVKAFANEAVPVYFYNKGATCHLLMGAPDVRAVKRTTNVRAITMSDLSIPVGADNENRLVVEHHKRVEALFVVVKPNALMGHPCDPATTTGLLVGDYGNPIASTHFIARKLRQVCFDSGVGRNVVNSGVVWVSTH